MLRLHYRERVGDINSRYVDEAETNEDNYTFSEGSNGDDTGRCGRGESSRPGGMERTGGGAGDAVDNTMKVA